MPSEAVIIANPHAGGGRARKSALDAERILTSQGIRTTVHSPQSLNELHSVTACLKEEKPAVVLACGGDGTVHQILQMTIPANLTLGIIPCGTGNDIARNIGLPTKVSKAYLEKLAELIHNRHFDTVDAPMITRESITHWSLGVISIGFDSAVTERANSLKFGRGTLRYVIALLAELRPFTPHNFAVEIDGAIYTDPALLIAIGNGQHYGGGMCICPDASMTDEYLNITWIGRAPRRTVVRLFPGIYSGRHIKHELVKTYKAREVSITSCESVIYADGERIGPPPVHITVKPRAAKILWKGVA